ncbi:hypothetical protein D3C87_1614820 [compost metagenome]
MLPVDMLGYIIQATIRVIAGLLIGFMGAWLIELFDRDAGRIGDAFLNAFVIGIVDRFGRRVGLASLAVNGNGYASIDRDDRF